MHETISPPFNPADPQFCADPYPAFHYLRAHTPLHWWAEGNTWLLTRYADVKAVLHDHRFGYAE